MNFIAIGPRDVLYRPVADKHSSKNLNQLKAANFIFFTKRGMSFTSKDRGGSPTDPRKIPGYNKSMILKISAEFANIQPKEFNKRMYEFKWMHFDTDNKSHIVLTIHEDGKHLIKPGDQIPSEVIAYVQESLYDHFEVELTWL
jgi:hypothetical protein